MSKFPVHTGATVEQWVDCHYHPYEIMSWIFVNGESRSHRKQSVMNHINYTVRFTEKKHKHARFILGVNFTFYLRDTVENSNIMKNPIICTKSRKSNITE